MAKNARRAVLFDVLSKKPAPRTPTTPATHVAASRWGALEPARAPAPHEAPGELPEDSVDSDFDPRDSLVRLHGGTLSIRLNSVAAIVAAAILCAFFLIAFAIGRRSAAPRDAAGPQTAAARDELPIIPLLSTADADQKATRDPREQSMTASDQEALDHLTTPPAEKQSTGAPPTRPRSNDSASAARKEKMVYLWIESVKAGTLAQQARDAQDIQKFLADNGVATEVRTTSDGLIIMSKEGFPESARAEQRAFRERIEGYGRLYPSQGGRYAFKGCFYTTRK